MQNSAYKFLREKIDFIKKTEKPYGILLVGSSRKILEKPETSGSDIDVFILKEDGCFEREVFYREGVEYDISYISLEELKRGVELELHSLISVLSRSETVYIRDEAKVLLDEIRRIAEAGPKKKDEGAIRYGRFRLTKSLETVRKRLNSMEFDFFLHNYLRELLLFYFEVKGDWVPPEKKLVSSIDDVELRSYVESLFENSESQKKLKSLERATDCILAPLGGALYNWDRSVYPFDFK